MSTNKLIDKLEDKFGNPLGPKQYSIIKEAITMLRVLEAELEVLRSASAFEEGRKLGMQQERALWELSRSTQEIENAQHSV